MCRLVLYVGPPIHLSDILLSPEHALLEQVCTCAFRFRQHPLQGTAWCNYVDLCPRSMHVRGICMGGMDGWNGWKKEGMWRWLIGCNEWIDSDQPRHTCILPFSHPFSHPFIRPFFRGAGSLGHSTSGIYTIHVHTHWKAASSVLDRKPGLMEATGLFHRVLFHETQFLVQDTEFRCPESSALINVCK